MEHLGAITVREAVPLIPGARVVAGAAGLGRVVRSVGVMEAPDGLRFAKPGDLLITALYAIREDREAQIRLVAELDRRGAAALAVKPSYVRRLPEEMLARSDALAFPLLELPTEVAYSEVMQPIFTEIVHSQAAVLARQHEVHRLLMQAVLEQRGLDVLARSLAALLENPVAILDPARQVLAWAPAGAGGRAGELLSLSGTEARQRTLVQSPAGAVHRRETLTAGGRRVHRVATLVLAGGRMYGQVLVWELGRPVQPLDLIALDAAVAVIALELANRRALVEVERRYRSEFLAALFSGDGGSEPALVQRARLFGLDLAAPHYVAVLRVGAPDDVYDLCHRAVDGQALVGDAELHTVVLQRAPAGASPRDHAAEWAGRLRDQLRALGGALTLSVGVGSARPGVEGVRKSFREARRAVAIGERLWGPGCLVAFEELGIFQLLDRLDAAEDLEPFLAGLRRLADYDRRRRTSLIPTLEAFFRHHGCVRDAASALRVHYNTVLYRLGRIEEVTGMDLDDPDSRLHLQLALKAARLAGVLSPPAAGRPGR